MKTREQTIRQDAVDNFLSSLDVNLPIKAHYYNAVRDACIYEWDKYTLVKILKGVEAAYNLKEKENAQNYS